MDNALSVCNDVCFRILLMDATFNRSLSGYCRCHIAGCYQVPGLAAEEVEQQITIPLERAINGLPGMHVMRSKSTFGLSMITIVFKDGTEDYWSRQRVQERLNEVELPYGASPGLDPLTSPVGEVYRYIIESDQHSLRD